MAGWLDALDDRSGPLGAAARAFCAAHAIEPTIRGLAAARALGRALDAFCHQVEGDDLDEDDRFVEQAGAYLGLVVLDAHGGPGHAQRDTRHRVLLGAHGCFDPFAAIDAALDADEPLHALADSLALAEAEARGDGPIAGVLAGLEAALRRAGDASEVSSRFELTVHLSNGAEVDLRRVAANSAWPRGAAQREQLDRDLDRIVSMLPRRRSTEAPSAYATSAQDVQDCLTRVLPRPVSRAFARDLPEGVRLATLPLFADVVLAFIEQHAGRARFLRADELDALGGVESVRTASLQNLERRSARVRFEPLQVGPRTWLAGKSGDGLDAARLVLPSAITLAKTLLPSVGVAVIPHRDTIVFAPIEDADALSHYAADLLARAPHPISAAALPLPLSALG